MARDVFKILFVSVFAVFVAAALPAVARSGSASDAQEEQAILVLRDIKQNYLASLQAEALRTKNPIPQKVSAGPSLWLTKVSPAEVNMATNRYERKAQDEVRLDGKVYHATGAAAELNMKLNPSTRFAKDPMTGKAVDKSEASTYADASGRVFYFGTDAAFKNFLALAEKETVFGYTSPK
ncbi:MAG: hypothetical protein HY883_02610 [Deltaproteobacteria bacterium]|nr:hypothetical protein [Deltaproteobacteria bacterium]